MLQYYTFNKRVELQPEFLTANGNSFDWFLGLFYGLKVPF